MNIAEEMEKLQDLHRRGALSTAEFEKAKAAVLDSAHASGPSQVPTLAEPAPRWKVPWGTLILLSVILLAFLTNPDRASLEKVCRDNMKENSANDGVLKKLAGAVLVETTFERKNYYVFSLGTIKSRVRMGGPQVEVEVLGAFGHWWFELLNTPLYETRKK